MTFSSRSGKIITLRPPVMADLDRLYGYARTLEAEDTYVLLNPDLPVTRDEEVEYLNACLKKIAATWQIHLLAFFNDTLIGSSQVTVGGRRKMHVGQFGISLLPEFRHDGIGFQLANTVINQARERLHLKLITLEVFAGNQSALNLYHKLGFQEYGRLTGGLKYRDSYQDAIHMYKSFS